MKGLERLAALRTKRNRREELAAVQPELAPLVVVPAVETLHVSPLEYEITVYSSEALALVSIIRIIQAGRDPTFIIDDVVGIADRLEAKLNNIVSNDQEGY